MLQDTTVLPDLEGGTGGPWRGPGPLVDPYGVLGGGWEDAPPPAVTVWAQRWPQVALDCSVPQLDITQHTVTPATHVPAWLASVTLNS